MNANNYNLIKGRSDLFRIDKYDIPFNMASQSTYNGINAFNLIVEARLYNKKPVFITPLQVSELGGNIIPPSDLIFKKDDVWKFFPGVEQNNIESYRKDLYLLYIKGQLQTTNEVPSPTNVLKISGGQYFNVFTKSLLHNKIYIDKRHGLNSSDVDKLSNMFYDDIKKFLDETGINYYSSSSDINTESFITLSNLRSNISHKVVSIDDVCGLKVDDLSKIYFLNSDIYKKEISEIKNIYETLTLMLSKKFTFQPLDTNNSTPIELIHKLLKEVSKIEILNIILKTDEIILRSNKDLLIELTTNSLFNKIGLYGFDESFQYFLDLVNRSGTYSIFKESHLLLQATAYSASKSIRSYFDYNSIKSMIDKVGGFSILKGKIESHIKTLVNINLYEKLSFSSKGNLTIYDINKLKYQLMKNGKNYLFDNWISNLSKSYNFEEITTNDEKLTIFLSGLSSADKKNIKSNVLENYYDAKARGELENYQSQNIDFDNFGINDFKAFISQNSMKNLIEFLYTKLDYNLVVKLELNLNDDNKISFRKDINKTLEILYSEIKNNISSEELKFFHEQNKSQKER